MNQNRAFWILGIGILLLGAFLRLYNLTDRPFHHDESLHAYYSYLYQTEGDYRYNPMLHGPFQFNACALIFKLFGDSNLNARLLPAGFGIFMILLCLLMYPSFGKAGALCASFFLAISPTIVYFSRFLREDIYFATFSLGILFSILKYLETKKYEYWYLASAFLSLAFCTKENAYFIAFSFISFGILYYLFKYIIPLLLKRGNKGELTQGIVENFKKCKFPLGTAFFIFWIIYLPLYTVFFHYPDDWNGFKTGLTYWYQQHQIQRIGAPWWYYLPFFGLYEFLPVILSLFAIVYIIRKKEKNPLALFLLYWFITSYILYSYAGEKVPWLMVHMTLPLILLSGWYLGKKIELKQYGIWIIAIPLILLTLNADCLANFRYSALDPLKMKPIAHAEMISYVQTTQDIPRFVQQVEKIKAQNPAPEKFSILVTGESAWPLSWYFRHYPNLNFGEEVGFQDMTMNIIISDLKNLEIDKQFIGSQYDYQIYQLRAWYPPPSLHNNTPLWQAIRDLFKEVTLSQLYVYFLTRETFWQYGSTDIVMWVRKN